MYFFMPLIEQKKKRYPGIYVFLMFFLWVILPLCLLIGISFIASIPILIKRFISDVINIYQNTYLS